jgi:hypothetical protein
MPLGSIKTHLFLTKASETRPDEHPIPGFPGSLDQKPVSRP